jgi:hypothetical protein
MIRRRKFKVPQKVDATLWLRLDDPAIDRDAKNLEILLNAARRVIKNPGYKHASKIQPTLYKRWRGPLFPLLDHSGKPFPKWRFLTPWMKTQVAGLVLQEGPFIQIRVHLHDGLHKDLETNGPDPKTYFRDRLGRSLRVQLGSVPMFYFVEENRTKSGLTQVRPHFHGGIQVQRVTPKSLKTGILPVRHRVVMRREGVPAMELMHGRDVVRDALLLASGNDEGRAGIYQGINQTRNVWCRKPYKPLFNPEWISYAFKNTKRHSRVLPKNRLVMSRGLNEEAQRFWRLVTEGETAMSQWT